MTATADSPSTTSGGLLTEPLALAAGVELLGEVRGTGYKKGAALVRRADGQMVQLSALMYEMLACADGVRTAGQLAEVISERLGRRISPGQAERLAEKLGETGLIAGTEHLAPPKRNPLLALRWKVMVTNPAVTRRLVAPFTFLFSPWIMWPVVAAFAAVFWFVMIDKGVAGATAQAFHDPALLLLVFALTVASAGFHELGHAAACRYGGATPGGMGMGLYLVWPAFYTDVTDAYRLPRRARLRVDLAGLYFNAVVAVATMVVWLFWRVDALLLLVALQLLQMVKQLSPIIRADGYHILADATGVPDLYAHMGPTVRGILPWRREPSALTGWARLLVTVWVLVLIPVMMSLMLGAVLLLPQLLTSAWDSGSTVVRSMPHDRNAISVLASVLRLVALLIPVAGSLLVTQKVLRTFAAKARAWSSGNVAKRLLVLTVGAAAAGGLAYAWWPAGQYHPVRPNEKGNLPALGQLIAAPEKTVRPVPTASYQTLAPGVHLALAMIPQGGATASHPDVFIIPGGKSQPATEILSWPGSTIAAGSLGSTGTPPTTGAEFPFVLPSGPGPNGTQAEAINTADGGVTYDVAYSLITVRGGAPVDETNSAYAIAHCNACTTVAVSFQVVLVVGHSKDIAPINASGALNYECPACSTTAIADQMVLTLKSQPQSQLLAQLQAILAQLQALPELGSSGTPSAVAAEVATVQNQITQELAASGLLAKPTTSTTSPGTTATSVSTPTSVTSPTGVMQPATPSGSASPTATSSPSQTTPDSSASTDTTVQPTTSSTFPSSPTTTSASDPSTSAPASTTATTTVSR